MAHSVLPWFLGEDVFDHGEEASFNGSILSVDMTEPEPEPYEVARHVDKQDAELIIRAVNSHADLVAACDLCLAIAKCQPAPELGDWNWPRIVEMLQAALAKAKEGT